MVSSGADHCGDASSRVPHSSHRKSAAVNSGSLDLLNGTIPSSAEKAKLQRLLSRVATYFLAWRTISTSAFLAPSGVRTS